MEDVFATDRLKQLLPSIKKFVAEELIPLESDCQNIPWNQFSKKLVAKR